MKAPGSHSSEWGSGAFSSFPVTLTRVNADTLYLEIMGAPEEWRCRDVADVFAGLLCGRLREHDGDHAELAKGHPHAVTIWPAR